MVHGSANDFAVLIGGFCFNFFFENVKFLIGILCHDCEGCILKKGFTLKIQQLMWNGKMHMLVDIIIKVWQVV